MKEQESLGPWICDQCGEPGDDDICLKCGNSRPIPGPAGPRAGTYGRFMGWPMDPLAARFFLFYPLMLLGAVIVVILSMLRCFR